MNRTETQLETAQAPARPRPLWSLSSLAVPIIAGVIAVALRPKQGSPLIGDFGVFIFGGILSSPLGILAAGVALIREERKRWVSALGVLVNLPLLALLLLFAGVFGDL